MRFLVLLWVAVEVLQIAVIALLAAGYRNLQRRLDEGQRFTGGPPRSVVDGRD